MTWNWTLDLLGMNKCRNKPLHHEGFISHINFAPHIPFLPARSESLPNTLALLPCRSFCLPTTTFPPHPTSFDPPNHRTSSKPPRTMPAKKKTTPAKSSTSSYHLHHVLLSCTTQNLDQLLGKNERKFHWFMAPVSFRVPVNNFSFSLANASFFVSFLSLAT